jgi:Tfp pilus assembly protein PilV
MKNIIYKNKIFSLKSLKNNSGFTIVETLVAITILMIAIAGPLTIAQKGLTASTYARDQMIASFLAQDGLEYAVICSKKILKQH